MNANQTTEQQQPAPQTIEGLFDSIAKVGAEYGFTSEPDEETEYPSRFLFLLDKYETSRIIFPTDYWYYKGTRLQVIIDRLSHKPFTTETITESKRTIFFSGSIDLSDTDFFDKLLNSIYPKSLTDTPY